MGDWPTNPPRLIRVPPAARAGRRNPHRLVLACAVVFAASQLGLVWWLLAHGVTSSAPAVWIGMGAWSFIAVLLVMRWASGQRGEVTDAGLREAAGWVVDERNQAEWALAEVLALCDRLDESGQDFDPDLIRQAVPDVLRRRLAPGVASVATEVAEADRG